MGIAVTEEELDERATAIESLSSEFSANLTSEKSSVESMEWQGAARDAFTAAFEEAEKQFQDVADQITGIATMLRDAKTGLFDADESIAGAIRGNG